MLLHLLQENYTFYLPTFAKVYFYLVNCFMTYFEATLKKTTTITEVAESLFTAQDVLSHANTGLKVLLFANLRRKTMLLQEYESQ